jgi:outer membrane protein
MRRKMMEKAPNVKLKTSNSLSGDLSLSSIASFLKLKRWVTTSSQLFLFASATFAWATFLTPLSGVAEDGASSSSRQYSKPSLDKTSLVESSKISDTQNVSSASPLLLDVFLKQVEIYHPKVAGAEAQRKMSRAKRLEKQGAFDPSLSFSSDYMRYNDTSKRGNLKQGVDNEVTLDYLTRSGIKVSPGYRYNRGDVKSPGNASGDAGEYFLSLKIPLLRGLNINEKSAAERQALIGEPLADADFFFNRLELLLKAANAYWDWVGNQRKMQVAKNILDLAVVRYDAVKQRAKKGDLPLIDAVEAEQEVQRRQAGWVKAQRDFQKSNFKLSLFLWDAQGNPQILPKETQVPLSTPEPVFYDAEMTEKATENAFQVRPELKIVNFEKRIAKIDFDLAQNQRLPALNLEVAPGLDTGGFSVGPTLKAGIGLTIPLRQRLADGKSQAAKLKIQKLGFDEKLFKQQIDIEVQDAVSAINTALERYQATQKEVALAQQMEQGERIRFNLGDSTIFLVNQRERATAEAQSRMIEVYAEYFQSVAQFKAVTGQL